MQYLNKRTITRLTRYQIMTGVLITLINIQCPKHLEQRIKQERTILRHTNPTHILQKFIVDFPHTNCEVN